MATVLEVITGAGIELGARALGDTLSAEEADRGLAVLQAMFNEVVDQGYFGRLNDYLATAAYTAKEQDRVYSAGFTITLPTTVVDTYTGDNRRPHDLAMIQVVNASTAPQISIYDAHTAAWTRIDNLTLTLDPCPLSGRNRHGLECALARRLAGTFQRPVPESTSLYAGGLASLISRKPSAPRNSMPAEFY